MSLFQSAPDEVRVLTGGVDIFSVLYARAQAAFPRGIWVEGFGTIKGGSIIELTGDKHRESVREATLSQWSATFVVDGDHKEVRSVGTLTWREKRAPQSLTGFLASAYATHVTLRIREVNMLHGDDALRVDETAPTAPIQDTPKKAAKTPSPTPSKAGAARSAGATQERASVLSEAIEEIPIRRPPSSTLQEDSAPTPAPAAAVGWGDLEAASSRVASSAQESTASIGWGDVAAASEQAAAPKSAAKAPTIQPAQQSLIDGLPSSADADAWGEVAEFSQAIEQTTTPTAAKTLKRGEVLVHPQLGDCTIINVLSETVVMVKPRGAKARKISLKPFVVTETAKRGFYALTRA